MIIIFSLMKFFRSQELLKPFHRLVFKQEKKVCVDYTYAKRDDQNCQTYTKIGNKNLYIK